MSGHVAVVASSFRRVLIALVGCLRWRSSFSQSRRHASDDRLDDLCLGLHGNGQAAPFYTNGVKLKLLQTAGQDPSSAGEYELDHIVPLALGGHPRALDNLQLQPWPEARRKDRLEVKLQCLVCSGQVSLGEAQTAIATDWEAAYHRYASVPCHRDRHPTVRTADRGTSAPRPHSTASSWLARVRQWLPTLGWHGLVRGSV